MELSGLPLIPKDPEFILDSDCHVHRVNHFKFTALTFLFIVRVLSLRLLATLVWKSWLLWYLYFFLFPVGLSILLGLRLL